MNKVLTGAIALIKVKGVTVGKMKNLQATESFRRGRVSGIGELVASEAPALEHSGQLQCEFYEVDYETTGLPDAIIRRAPSIQDFVDNVLLQEDGIDLVIFKKVEDLIDPATKLIRAKPRVHASINRCFLDQESMNIGEGQISGHNQTFSFLDPIIYSL